MLSEPRSSHRKTTQATCLNMHSTIPRTLADYRDKTQRMQVYNLKRPRCPACEKQTTTRDLQMFGRCYKCHTKGKA